MHILRSVIVFTAAGVLLAQGTPAAKPDPMSADIKAFFDSVKGFITRSAEKMPEEHYSFKPTPDVRSFGQMVGHIADAQYLFCSALKGEKQAPTAEKTKTTKAELTAALAAAFAYCDPTYSGLTDAKGAEPVKLFGSDRTKLGVLAFNNGHNYEHYGNLVTYMRLKSIVPPSSEPRR